MKRGSLRNIIRVLNMADRIDISEGRVSYFRYHEILRGLADRFGAPFPETVAVFAATSPNSDYHGNLRSTASILDGWKRGIDPERIRVVTYNHCRDRAFEYLTGRRSFLGSVGGPKIRSFYQNILNPLDPGPVTIDGHAVNIWTGKRQNLKAVVSGWNYDRVADDYRAAAKRVGLLPNQVQAITWFTWKRVHRILYKDQPNIFDHNPADFWKTLADPNLIEPFEPFGDPSPSTLKRKQI